jgi:hypothetical protein
MRIGLLGMGDLLIDHAAACPADDTLAEAAIKRDLVVEDPRQVLIRWQRPESSR